MFCLAPGIAWAASVLFGHHWVESSHVNVTQVPAELSVTFARLGQGSNGDGRARWAYHSQSVAFVP